MPAGIYGEKTRRANLRASGNLPQKETARYTRGSARRNEIAAEIRAARRGGTPLRGNAMTKKGTPRKDGKLIGGKTKPGKLDLNLGFTGRNSTYLDRGFQQGVNPEYTKTKNKPLQSRPAKLRVEAAKKKKAGMRKAAAARRSAAKRKSG